MARHSQGIPHLVSTFRLTHNISVSLFLSSDFLDFVCNDCLGFLRALLQLLDSRFGLISQNLLSSTPVPVTQVSVTLEGLSGEVYEMASEEQIVLRRDGESVAHEGCRVDGESASHGSRDAIATVVSAAEFLNWDKFGGDFPYL